MHVFYTPDIQAHAELPEEEAAHAVRVLRLQAGDEVMLTDGKGCFYRAEISTATNKRCLVNILETLPQAPLWKGHLHIAMAPTKNMDRTEWFAEKATEIGFDELTFLNCRFSERKVIKTERISKILVSAIKQSLKARLPQLNEMTDFNKFITRLRIGRAEYLLQKYDLSIDEVASQCGFRDTGYFRKVFGKHLGLTPSKYKKASNNREQGTP